MAALQNLAIGEFDHGGRRQPDGTWQVTIDRATYARMREHKAPGESISALIIRMMQAVAAQRRASLN